MNTSRVVIAAPRGRSGKTLLSMGLCAAIRARGLAVQPFKRGPDYIDPSWLTTASGRDCRSLDIHLMGEAGTLSAFHHGVSNPPSDFALIEGAMGLFDGLGLAGEGSSAHVARLLQAPVILIIDASRMTRSVAALIDGFQHFEPDLQIAGIVFNHVNHTRHLKKLRKLTNYFNHIPVLGALPDEVNLNIPQRHLGLMPHHENAAFDDVVAHAEQMICQHVNLDEILEIGCSAPPIEIPNLPAQLPAPAPLTRIGVAMDKAFRFYYSENLEALHMAGAEIIPFNALTDDQLPTVDGLYLGGGFPELFMAELSANTALRHQIRAAIADGMPVYAECGGLMYLARTICYQNVSLPMVGALPCDVEMTSRPQGHGYVHLRTTHSHPFFPPDQIIRGHEFHHSRIIHLENPAFAYHVDKGQGIDGASDGLVTGNVLAGYTHLHASGTPNWADKMVQSVRHGSLTGNLR